MVDSDWLREVFGGAATLIVLLFWASAMLLAVAWATVPFVLFKTKRRLDASHDVLIAIAQRIGVQMDREWRYNSPLPGPYIPRPDQASWPQAEGPDKAVV
jgi:hypothetical protein